MKTSQVPVSQSGQQGEQEPVDHLNDLLETKPANSGVVNTLMGMLDDEYTVDKLLKTLRGLVPIVDHIKQSIEASSVSIPSVSTQLSSVTQATETATVTILNNLETLTTSLTNAEETLAKVGEQSRLNQTADEQFGNVLNKIAASRTSDADIVNLLTLWKQRDGEPKTRSYIDSIQQGLAGAQGTLMQIAMALQVQDITSQQIAGVVHLIEEVRIKLSQTLFQVEHQHEQQEHPHASSRPRAGSFDMHASFSTSPDKQSNTDEIIEQWTAQQTKK